MDAGEVGDLSGGRLGFVKVERQGAANRDVLERLPALRADDGLDAAALGRLEEIAGAVGAGREQEENSRARPTVREIRWPGLLTLQTRSSIDT